MSNIFDTFFTGNFIDPINGKIMISNLEMIEKANHFNNKESIVNETWNSLRDKINKRDKKQVLSDEIIELKRFSIIQSKGNLSEAKEMFKWLLRTI